MLVTHEKRIEDITLEELRNGEITLRQLNEIYNKLGFVFIGRNGKFKGIIKEIRN